ncbi:hypothetical protein PCANC_27076 [Puccinia coronata f. sp. avenae]|uniref:Uncharacterized protein n=1 Tax=Puccinia coronata f. sp. avenae TaxID=200324 RepID=A0A2N5TKZ8_9BASI|nr:hypothetical protein PCANC_27076 [Puccinia coronata f. sp. avenae]
MPIQALLAGNVSDFAEVVRSPRQESSTALLKKPRRLIDALQFIPPNEYKVAPSVFDFNCKTVHGAGGIMISCTPSGSKGAIRKPKTKRRAAVISDNDRDSSDEEIKRIAWGHPTASTDSRPSGSGSHPTPTIKDKGKAPAGSGSHPTPTIKAKGKAPAQASSKTTDTGRRSPLQFVPDSIVREENCGRPSGSGTHPTPTPPTPKPIKAKPRFPGLAFDPDSIVWDENCGRLSGSGTHPTPPTPKSIKAKPRFPGLAIDPPLAGRTAFTMYLYPSQVGMHSSAVSQALTRLNVGRTFTPHDPVDPNFKPTISRLKVGDEWRYIEHGQAGRVSVAKIPTTPAAAAAADSLYYWNPKDDTKHNIADETAAHLLDSSPNLIAGLPKPLAADELKKTSDDLLDLGWCVIDGSEYHSSECDLPPHLPHSKSQRHGSQSKSQRDSSQ